MFSLMKMFGKTRKSGARKNKSKSRRSKSRLVRRTRKSRTAKKVKKGGMIPFI